MRRIVTWLNDRLKPVNMVIGRTNPRVGGFSRTTQLMRFSDRCERLIVVIANETEAGRLGQVESSIRAKPQ